MSDHRRAPAWVDRAVGLLSRSAASEADEVVEAALTVEPDNSLAWALRCAARVAADPGLPERLVPARYGRSAPAEWIELTEAILAVMRERDQRLWLPVVLEEGHDATEVWLFLAAMFDLAALTEQADADDPALPEVLDDLVSRYADSMAARLVEARLALAEDRVDAAWAAVRHILASHEGCERLAKPLTDLFVEAAVRDQGLRALTALARAADPAEFRPIAIALHLDLAMGPDASGDVVETALPLLANIRRRRAQR